MTEEKAKLVCVLSAADAMLLTLNKNTLIFLQHKISVFKNYDRNAKVFTQYKMLLILISNI